MILLWVSLAVVLLYILLSATALRLVGGRSIGRALLAGLLIGILPPLVQLAGLMAGLDDLAIVWIILGAAVLAIVVGLLVIRLLYRGDANRTVVLWMAAFAPSTLIMALLMLFVIEPFAMQAYVVPSHSMAPTLLGPHRRGECPDGEGLATVPVLREGDTELADPTGLGVCHATGQGVRVRVASDEVQSADRFIADKLRTPQRWDVVVFRSPEDPNQLLVKRLVGMPGETLQIKDGQVWINDEPQQPPSYLTGLHYEPLNESVIAELIRSKRVLESIGKPIHLSEDEIYVLGDFTERSIDSRYWGPVSRSSLIGVAELVYWPMDRFQLLP